LEVVIEAAHAYGLQVIAYHIMNVLCIYHSHFYSTNTAVQPYSVCVSKRTGVNSLPLRSKLCPAGHPAQPHRAPTSVLEFVAPLHPEHLLYDTRQRYIFVSPETLPASNVWSTIVSDMCNTHMCITCVYMCNPITHVCNRLHKTNVVLHSMYHTLLAGRGVTMNHPQFISLGWDTIIL
jgi:hypothetical protein